MARGRSLRGARKWPKGHLVRLVRFSGIYPTPRTLGDWGLGCALGHYTLGSVPSWSNSPLPSLLDPPGEPSWAHAPIGPFRAHILPIARLKRMPTLAP